MDYNPLELEKEILDFWEKNKIYQKSKNKGKQFYFLDGPPYTSGKVHIGTAWNKILKDSFLRYKRMNKVDVWDRAGYDMHGLPTEHAVLKKLGIKDKDQVEKYGVKKFIEECKKFSIENMNTMTDDFKRLGIWMDFENAYQTIKDEYIDAEWWLIKKAHENKRLYESKKTMSWCPHCETALAKHELEYESIKENLEGQKSGWYCGYDKEESEDLIKFKPKCGIKFTEKLSSNSECYGIKAFASQSMLVDAFKVKYKLCWNERE